MVVSEPACDGHVNVQDVRKAVTRGLTLCSKPSTNYACLPEETVSTEVDRSEPADSVPGPRRPTARGRSSGSSHGSTCPEESRGGERGARGGRAGAAVGQQHGRGIWTSNYDASQHESLNKEAVVRLFIQQARAADANGVSKKLTVDR